MKRISLFLSNEDDVVEGPQTLVALVRRCMEGPERPVMAERVAGTFVATSNRALVARIDAVASALIGRGIAAGDRIALMSPNRIDWFVANLAIQSAGGVTVPLYPTQALDQVQFILDDSSAKLLFVDAARALQRLRDGGVRLPDAVVFDEPGEGGFAAMERAEAELAARSATPAQRAAQLQPDDLAVLIYTSGTTGVPKGVMLSHRNIASNATSAFDRVRDVLPGGDPIVSVLPWAHIYEHTNLFGLFLRHAVIYVSHSPDDLLRDLQEVKPVAFFAVPRIFERVLAGIVAKAKADGGVKGRLVPWALGVGREYMRATMDGHAAPAALRLQYAVAKALVLKKLRPALGLDRIRFICSGSAPLHLDVSLTFAAAEVLVLEGYGLTEASPVVCVNSVHRYRIGTVGFPIEGVEVKLADDGELMVRGPNVMQGYYHDPAATQAVMHEGWLATGDIATIDADGFIRIVDRKKELFKTSGGKFIAPGRVESAIMRSPFVSQVMVLGAGRPHPIALVSPNWTLMRAELGLDEAMDNTEAAKLPRVRDFMTRVAAKNTADLAPYEQVRRVGILPRDLTIEGNELSPTLKIRRRIVELRYVDLIEQTYAASVLHTPADAARSSPFA